MPQAANTLVCELEQALSIEIATEKASKIKETIESFLKRKSNESTAESSIMDSLYKYHLTQSKDKAQEISELSEHQAKKLKFS